MIVRSSIRLDLHIKNYEFHPENNGQAFRKYLKSSIGIHRIKWFLLTDLIIFLRLFWNDQGFTCGGEVMRAVKRKITDMTVKYKEYKHNPEQIENKDARRASVWSFLFDTHSWLIIQFCKSGAMRKNLTNLHLEAQIVLCYTFSKAVVVQR